MRPASILKSVDHLGLDPAVERTMIGFMGCYAAINALKIARHIVRSEPATRVLVVNLELCTLHLQQNAGSGTGVVFPCIRRWLRCQHYQRR